MTRGIIINFCLASVVGISMNSLAFGETNAKSQKKEPFKVSSAAKHTTSPEKLVVAKQEVQPEAPKKTISRSDQEIANYKASLSDQGNGLALRQRIRALARLAEVQGEDVTNFLIARRNQIDLEMKTAPVHQAKELQDLRYAIDKILNTRSQYRYAGVE